MKLVDVNVLIYVVNRRDPQHAGALKWWLKALAGDEPVGLCWMVLLGFLRVITNPRALEQPLSMREAARRVQDWLEHPNTQVVGETPEHWRVLSGLLNAVQNAANLTMDAHLAALAMTHDATLVSCDADFARFEQLRWQHPLAAS